LLGYAFPGFYQRVAMEKRKKDYFNRLADWRENQESVYMQKFDSFIEENERTDAYLKKQSV